MKSSFAIHLNNNEKTAVEEFKRKVLDFFPATEFVLFGSKAKGDYREFSDIDVLLIINGEAGGKTEKRIFDIAYDVELQFNVVLGIIVESRDFWDSDLCRETPLRRNIDREGVLI